MKPYTLSDIDRDFDTEEKCIAFLEGLRWPDGVTCVKCGKQHISRVRTVARGRSKGTKGTEWTRRLYECLGCGEQFSVKSGTLFHDTHLPLQKWFRAIVVFAHFVVSTLEDVSVEIVVARSPAHRRMNLILQDGSEFLREQDVEHGDSFFVASHVVPFGYAPRLCASVTRLLLVLAVLLSRR